MLKVKVISTNGYYYDPDTDFCKRATLADLLDRTAYCINSLNMALSNLDYSKNNWSDDDRSWSLDNVTYFAEELANCQRLIDKGIYDEVDNYGTL